MEKGETRAGEENRGKTGFPSRILSSKLEALREAIRELEAEIRARKALSEKFVEAIQQESERIRDLVSRLGEPWSKGYLPAIEELRANLTRELFNLANRERAERLRVWEDVVALKKQRRTLLMECQALEKTAELMEDPQRGGDA